MEPGHHYEMYPTESPRRKRNCGRGEGFFLHIALRNNCGFFLGFPGFSWGDEISVVGHDELACQ